MTETVALTPAIGVEVCGISGGVSELRVYALIDRGRRALVV